MISAQAEEAPVTQERDVTRQKRLALKGHRDFSLCPFVFLIF